MQTAEVHLVLHWLTSFYLITAFYNFNFQINLYSFCVTLCYSVFIVDSVNQTCCLFQMPPKDGQNLHFILFIYFCCTTSGQLAKLFTRKLCHAKKPTKLDKILHKQYVPVIITCTCFISLTRVS